jgi:ankyrin repeat protein
MKHKKLISFITFWILAIVPGLCVLSAAANESWTNTEAEQHMEKANEFRKVGDYDAAIAEYKKVIVLSDKTESAQNAHYWIGQCYFEAGQFDAALSAFQKLLEEYPESMIIPSAKQMIKRIQQAKKNRALFEAVKKADVEQVKLLIAEGADIDAKWGDVNTKEEEKKAEGHAAYSTPLCHAVSSNNMDVVKLLVEAGADVNAAGSWPPLCRAVDENNTAIAEYLIDHGANVNAYPLDEGWGPLQETTALSNGVEMAKLLLARGADINSKGYPVLNSAVYEKRRDLCEFLIQRGADVNAKDMWGQTSLYLAIRNGDSDIMDILIANGVDINAKDDRGQTLIHRMLDIRRNSGNSGYLKAKDTKDMVELLLAKGADVNLKDKAGRTPLHLAAESADADIVKLLLDKGASIDEKDDESGATALHYAARIGNKDAAEVLIARGADINAKDKQGHTPLQVAVNHDYKVAELLINKGADSGIRAESDRTLLDLAQQRKQIESRAPDLIFDGEPNNWFGLETVCGDVDGDGYDDILIGATRYDNNRGRVYLFYGGPHMDATADLIFEGQNKGDFFGGIACGDIDHDGYEDILIGAGSQEELGRAYLYWGSDRDSMDAKPDKIFTGENKKGSRFGYGSAIYDIDNDGYDDIILGAYWYPGDATGRVYLYYGNKKESMDTSYDLIFTAEKAKERFGYIISCGDVDNDGYGDMVIRSGADQCPAYLYYGANKSNMDAKVDVVFEAPSRRYKWGHGLLCVDQNGDGYDDILIGATGYNDWQGRAYLFYGSSKRSLDTDPDMIFDGEVEGSLYGVREACGDIDGDKVNDLIIAASGCGQRVGRVYVYWGKELAAPNPKPGMILTGENPNDEFGARIACGDVNNDGFDDLIVAALAYKAGAKQGRVYLYYGGPRNK